MNKIIKVIKRCQTVKYRNIEYFYKLSDPFKVKFYSLFQLKICSLQKKKYNFHILLHELNINLDIMAITESHITENVLMSFTYATPKLFY